MSVNALFNNGNIPQNGVEQKLTIRRPDDWHIHLRDGAMLEAVLPFTASQFKRGIIMPNLVPPVTRITEAESYRQRILAARPKGNDFQPFMTCYLTDQSDADEIERGFRDKVWIAAKLYPAGATTNSHNGVTDLDNITAVFERMEKIGMPVLIHGEVTDPTVDIFDREAIFMEKTLVPFLKRFEGLKVVVEHATTKEALAVVRSFAPRVAATITPHHLVINRTSIFQGGLQPHLYCLPVAKREVHRLALRQAATSGESCFFIGTDTAPHMRTAKEASCCSAGVFAGATALQTYVQVFDEEGALDRFEAFASFNGANFHGLPVNEDTITLIKKTQALQPTVEVGDSEVVIFRGGETLPWRIET